MTRKLSGRMLAAIAIAVVAVTGACQPSAPPPDLVKSQREALDKAKAVEGLLQQQGRDQKQAVDEAAK
ncbi:hypothetical protein [Noviherbaspirillum sedimenti]|uniref:Lipoprotein n=1 Tax=Noviherbaspirillum sedimenti TaxID=2320865 RepID=A0A3A3FZH6_9BURK|nr:hypothetical protein [Noviherbaspirillum sedimenti]RJG00775.1 hypothetical protein D3878_03560 [Noviherbaspirillum sedimenti]